MSSIVKKNAGDLLVEDIRCGMVRKSIPSIEALGEKSKIGRSAIHDRMNEPGKIDLDQLTRIMRATGIKEITIRASDTYTIKRRNKK